MAQRYYQQESNTDRYLAESGSILATEDSYVTTFLEPGGDATFNIAIASSGGLWDAKTGSSLVKTDFVHGDHQRSLGNAINTNNHFDAANVLQDAGSRISFYFYINALPTSTCNFCVSSGAGGIVVQIALTSAGVIRLNRASSVQIGTNGATLSTGTWYRISLAYTITSTTVNRFELFIDGSSTISVTNATLINVTGTDAEFGTIGADTTADFRFSDIYIDNSSSLADTGDIWVTAKRPNANGTNNAFVTQIGSGGSGYGSGHSPQVNERALSGTNGWSVVAVGATTEEYNIEDESTGDIDISTGTVIDYMGWVYAKALVSETGQIKINGTNSPISLTSTTKLFRNVANSSTYPAGTGSDIGIVTDATATTVSLYEAGVIVAYIPGATASAYSSQLMMLGVG